MGICEGRTVIITGAGRGIGRAHALAFGAEGANVVVNDLGVSLTGGADAGPSPAEEVVAEIEAAGGRGLANHDDCSDWEGAGRLVEAALEVFGGLDTLVCNAGIVRDRMIANMSVEEWDAVMRVHLRGTFCPVRHAAGYWKDEAKAGRPRAARVITTSSGAGLMGSVGQGNYSAAKAGILGFSLVAAAELGRYGVTVNSIAPAARSRMTEDVFVDMMARPESGFDRMAPENVSPLVVWLGSEESGDVTGRAFEVQAGEVSVADGWHHGVVEDKGDRWAPSELGPVVRRLIAGAPQPTPVYGA